MTRKTRKPAWVTDARAARVTNTFDLPTTRTNQSHPGLRAGRTKQEYNEVLRKKKDAQKHAEKASTISQSLAIGRPREENWSTSTCSHPFLLIVL
jgi:hypothetical protein